MRDHQAGLASHQPIQGLAHFAFALDVQAGHRLIQNQDGGIANEGAGDGDALLLSAGESRAAFADDRVITIFQFADELVGIGGPGRRPNLLLAGLRFAVGNVFVDGRSEENGLLEDDADLSSQGFAPIMPDVHAVNTDETRLWFVEAQEQADDSGFARSGGTHQSQPLTRRNPKGNIPQHFFAVAVIKGNVVEDDFPAQPLRFDGAGAVLDLRFGVEHLGDAFGAGRRFGKVCGQLGQAAQRFVDVVEVSHRQDQFARQHPVLEHLQCSEEHRCGHGQRSDDFRGAIGGGLQPAQADALLQGLRSDVVELFLFIPLPPQGLNQRHGREHLAHAGEGLALAFALAFDRELGLVIAKKHGISQQRQRGQGDQPHLPVQGEHDGQHPDDHEQVGTEL